MTIRPYRSIRRVVFRAPAYKTKRGVQVMEETLACGHMQLHDAANDAAKRVCNECMKERERGSAEGGR